VPEGIKASEKIQKEAKGGVDIERLPKSIPRKARVNQTFVRSRVYLLGPGK